jgi:sugar phosphate isomerase/epimerase
MILRPRVKSEPTRVSIARGLEDRETGTLDTRRSTSQSQSLYCRGTGSDLHLGYCTNVHPGETWAQTFDALERWTLEVKRRLGRSGSYGIGLRLSDRASRELSERTALLEFQRWLERHDCYVFTINGFPFGQFHAGAVKERVYLPDWTQPERVDYTVRLFELLSKLVPASVEGSVSTLPGGLKEFTSGREPEAAIRANLWRCVEQIARVSEQAGRTLHLGLEPEPCCLLENSVEAAAFFDRLREEHPGDPRLDEHLGVTYDTCHFAVEFEAPADALARLREHGIRISKIQLSNALSFSPKPALLDQLAGFAENIYLHQVILRREDGSLERFKDLDLALAKQLSQAAGAEEWRVHFHVPLNSEPAAGFGTTASHITGVLEEVRKEPRLCAHLEIETYTWAVLPEPLKTHDVCEQITGEYQWVLERLAERGWVTG